MMKALTDKKWGAFYISDEKENGIFKLRSSLSGIRINCWRVMTKKHHILPALILIMELLCSLEKNKAKNLK